MKKTTKKENFGKIIEILEEVGREDLVEVMQHEIELIDKKASSGKLTKTQTENEDIKTLILKELTRIGRAVTITELLKESTEVNKATAGSNQKVSALMTQLKNSNKVMRIQEGKKATFMIMQEVQEEEEETEE